MENQAKNKAKQAKSKGKTKTDGDEDILSEEEEMNQSKRATLSIKQSRIFFDYINFDWEGDKAWQAFMNANPEIVADKRDQEEAKREFFKQHINAKFDTQFTINDDDERDRFIEFVKYNNTLRCLTAIHERQSDTVRLVCHAKHLCFVGFLFCFPLKTWQPAAICYVLAHILSIIHMFMTRRPKDDPFGPRLFSEEEIMTIFAYVIIIISGPIVRGLLYPQLLIWAFISTCEWLNYILERRPNFPILCALTPILEIISNIWLEIVKLKNYIEVFTMFFSCIGWIFGLNAPLMPVIYTQFVRIKAISSQFTKNSFIQLHALLEDNLPEGIYLAFVEPVARYIASLAENVNSTPKPEEEDEDEDEVGSDSDQKKEVKKKQKNSKKKKEQVINDQDDEPKIYEVVDDKAQVPQATYEDLD